MDRRSTYHMQVHTPTGARIVRLCFRNPSSGMTALLNYFGSDAKLGAFRQVADMTADEFRSDKDSLPKPEYAGKQFQAGLVFGNTPGAYVTISEDMVWGGAYPSPYGPGHMAMASSSERLGYHAQTCALVAGFLASEAPIIQFLDRHSI